MEVFTVKLADSLKTRHIQRVIAPTSALYSDKRRLKTRHIQRVIAQEMKREAQLFSLKTRHIQRVIAPEVYAKMKAIEVSKPVIYRGLLH